LDELIVVEGKNDAHAVRRALGNVDVIWTEGFGLTEKTLKYIAETAKRRGVVVCTDPDFAGGQIREKIMRRVPEARHVYLPREMATKNGDIGLENVSPDNIRKAFAKILTTKLSDNEDNSKANNIFMQDMIENGLTGCQGSAGKRAALGKILGVGETNTRQFLHRTGRFSISREEFFKALKKLEGTGE